MDCLKRLESSAVIVTMPVKPLSHPVPLYKAHAVHEVFPFNDPFKIWGLSVEALSRATMTLKEKSASWDVLTPRMLVWRALIGADSGKLGEWTRTQVISNIATVV